MTTHACHCNNCKGSQFLPENRIKSHRRAYGIASRSPGITPSQSGNKPVDTDTITNEIWRLTLQGATSTPNSKRGEAFWEREADSQPDSSIPANDKATPTSTPPTSMGSLATEIDPGQAVYEDLLLLDFDIHKHKADVADMKVRSAPDAAEHQEAWFLATLKTLKNTDSSGVEAAEYLRTSMMEVVSDEIHRLQKWMAENGRARPAVPYYHLPKECVIDTGALFCLPATVLM